MCDEKKTHDSELQDYKPTDWFHVYEIFFWYANNIRSKLLTVYYAYGQMFFKKIRI